MLILLLQCANSTAKKDEVNENFNAIKKEVEQKKFNFNTFNEKNLKDPQALNNFKEKAIKFDLFNFKKRRVSFEIYLTKEQYKGSYDIAIFDQKDNILKFISKTTA